MKFSEFINKLYSRYACNSGERFVLQIFSALCGESNPVGTSAKDKYAKHELHGSDSLPAGLRSHDPSTRKALYDEDSNGLSAPIREHIIAYNNKDTFVIFSEKTVSIKGFSGLCDDFNIENITSKEYRSIVFTAIYEQFMQFAKSKDDDAADVISRTVRELSDDQSLKASKINATKSEKIRKQSGSVIMKQKNGLQINEVSGGVLNISLGGNGYANSNSFKNNNMNTINNLQYRVIILDDDYYRAQQYEDALNDTGFFDCEVTENVRDLFEKINQCEYDAYILDVHINDRSRYFGRSETLDGWRTGLVTYQRIREIKPDAIVVALTHSKLPEVVEWFTSEDFVKYYHKEKYPPRKFASALTSFLETIKENY